MGIYGHYMLFSFVPQAFRQVKKLHEEAFKGGGKGEASSSWKGEEIKKEEVTDEEEQKAGCMGLRVSMRWTSAMALNKRQLAQ